MANANKAKGDRAERAVRDYVTERYPGSFKTRAGFNDDLGDVLVGHPGGIVVLQVKDVAAPAWSAWFKQLAEQVGNCVRHVRGTNRVLGGAVVHKARGTADASAWRAVLTLGQLIDLVDAAYAAGHDDAVR